MSDSTSIVSSRIQLMELLIDLRNHLLDEDIYMLGSISPQSTTENVVESFDPMKSKIKQVLPNGVPPKDMGPIPTLESLRASAHDLGRSEWELLRERALACARCELHRTRIQVVFGSGDPKSRLMLIGEAPGEEEDKQGFPFVGRAGALLTQMLEAIGLSREQVYIGNILKCRPPGNRNPLATEIQCCSPWLDRQIEYIQPKLILTLGTFASQYILETKTPISSLRGKIIKHRAFHVIPTFHPSYLIRPNGFKEKVKVWDDLRKVAMFLGLK